MGRDRQLFSCEVVRVLGKMTILGMFRNLKRAQRQSDENK